MKENIVQSVLDVKAVASLDIKTDLESEQHKTIAELIEETNEEESK